MKKYVPFLFLWLSFWGLQAQNTLLIRLKDNILLNPQTNDYLYNKIYLLTSNANGTWEKIDSALIGKDNSFILTKRNNLSKSYYRLAFTQEGLQLGIYRDIILQEQKKDTLKIHLSYLDFKKDLFFEHDKENQALQEALHLINAYQNLKKYYLRMVNPENLSYLDEKYLTKYQEIESRKIQSFDSLQRQIQDFQRKYANTYAADILISLFSEPIIDMQYTQKYDNRRAFLKENFIKNWNFDNDLLLTNPFLESRLYEYLSDYTYIHTFEGIRYSVDNLLKNSKKNAKIFDFILNYLIKTYLQNGFESMVNYIYDTYYDACSTPVTSASEELKKVELLKKLAVGKTAPALNLTNQGLPAWQTLLQRNEVTLLYFWASTCEYCRNATPVLVKAVEKYPKVNIVTVSLDTKQEEWKQYLKNMPNKWLHYCDLHGWKSEVVKEYVIRRTPTTYLIDKQGTIIARELHPTQIESFLSEYFHSKP